MSCADPTFSHRASHPVILEAMLFPTPKSMAGRVLMDAQKPLEFRQRVGVGERGCGSPSGNHP